jgi:hypothetical protein
MIFLACISLLFDEGLAIDWTSGIIVETLKSEKNVALSPQDYIFYFSNGVPIERIIIRR